MALPLLDPNNHIVDASTLTAPALTLLLLAVLSAWALPLLWLLWEIEHASKPRRNRGPVELNPRSSQGHCLKPEPHGSEGDFALVAASRFYRFFDYELSIFIACRAFRKGQQDGGHPTAATRSQRLY